MHAACTSGVGSLSIWLATPYITCWSSRKSPKAMMAAART
jgi:hypothetical protein